MSVPFIQPSFSAGELAPALYGRVDFNKYAIGLSTCRNMFPSLRGGAYSRAGTGFAGFSKQTGRTIPPRLITFQFNILQGLALELGHLYMRVISNGAFVTEGTTAITAITQANPGVVTDVAHGYVTGDWVYLAAIGGMTQLNGQTLIVVRLDADHYSLTDVYGNAIDTTAFGAYTAGGTAARIYTLVTPWAEADLAYIKFTQSADVMTLTCWNQQTGTSYSAYDLARLSDANWTLTAFGIGATIAAPSGVIASPQSSVLASTYYSYVVTAVSAANGEESIASSSVTVHNNDIAVNAGSNIIGWQAVSGASAYNVYKAPASYGAFTPAGSPYGFMTTSPGQTAIDTNIIPDFSQVPPTHGNPFALGAIADIVRTAGGVNYSQQTIGYTITTGTGSGFAGTPVVTPDGKFAGFVIQNPGHDYAPADTIAITDSGGGLATGNYVVGTNGTDGATITINGVALKFRRAATAPAFNEFTLGNTIALTLQSLANYLNASSDISLNCALYTYDATHLYITYKTPGAVGNAFALGAGPAGWTASAGTLAGGGTAGSGATATLTLTPATGLYPSTVAYFQQRRVYAGSPSHPDTYWMSQPGAFKNFDARIPPLPTDAITGTPWSVQVNGIQFLVSMPGGLVALTGLEAWQLTGAGGSSLNPQPITPASQQAQPQAYNGCDSKVPPIKIDYDINYIQAKGSLLRDLSYNFFSNIYTGTDLTYLSSHLFLGHQVLEMAWCEEPYRLIWATRDDGILLSLSYFKQQDVMGWAHHDTNGQFWSVCSVTEPPIDALYLASQRILPKGTAYLIERMNDRIWAANENTWCVDAGVSTVLPQPAATLSASSSRGAGIPTGVTGLVGGAGYSPGTVGHIQDPTGAGAAVTLTIAAGVITGVVIAGGGDYTYPALEFIDPAGTGAGAAATVVLDNSALFVASAPIFNAGMVGSTIRMGGGRATVTVYLSTTRVTAQITSPIVQTIPNSGGVPAPATSGNWSIAPNVVTVGGAWHLEGMSVVGIADGKPFGPKVVSALGTIALDAPASLITYGLAFTPQMQSLYLDTGSPTIQAQRGKLAAVSVRVEASGVGSILAGGNQPDGAAQSPAVVDMPWGVLPASPLTPLQLPASQNLPPYGSTIVPLWTGDVRVPISGGYAKPKQVALQQTQPLPMQVLAIIPEFLPGDISEESGRGNGQAEPGRRGGGWGPQAQADRRTAG